MDATRFRMTIVVWFVFGIERFLNSMVGNRKDCLCDASLSFMNMYILSFICRTPKGIEKKKTTAFLLLIDWLIDCTLHRTIHRSSDRINIFVCPFSVLLSSNDWKWMVLMMTCLMSTIDLLDRDCDIVLCEVHNYDPNPLNLTLGHPWISSTKGSYNCTVQGLTLDQGSTKASYRVCRPSTTLCTTFRVRPFLFYRNHIAGDKDSLYTVCRV